MLAGDLGSAGTGVSGPCLLALLPYKFLFFSLVILSSSSYLF